MREQSGTTLQREGPLSDHPQRGLPSSNPVNMPGSSLWFPQPPTPATVWAAVIPTSSGAAGEETGCLKCPLIRRGSPGRDSEPTETISRGQERPGGEEGGA